MFQLQHPFLKRSDMAVRLGQFTLADFKLSLQSVQFIVHLVAQALSRVHSALRHQQD